MGFKRFDLRVAFSMATISIIMGFGAPERGRESYLKQKDGFPELLKGCPRGQWFPPVRSPWTHRAGQAVGDRCGAASENSRFTGIKVRDAGSGGGRPGLAPIPGWTSNLLRDLSPVTSSGPQFTHL